MELMDEKRPEFTLIAPFMPFGRNNLIGWMAGRCDGDHYGELVVYRFPKQELVFILEPQRDAGRRTRDLARHERLAAKLRLVVEQDAVRGEDAIFSA